MRKLWVLSVVLIGCFVAGCSPRVMVKPAIWEDKASKIGVMTAQVPRAHAHTPSGQGILDVAITNAATSTMAKYLGQIEITSFQPVADEFVAEMQKRGMNAVKIAEVLDLESKPNKMTEAEFIKQSASQAGVDKVILLSINKLGTSRLYYGFIPLGSPDGFCLAQGVMLDASTSKPVILWKTDMGWMDGCVSVIGEWDEAPDYPNLTQAISKAVDNAKDFLKRDFFGSK